MTRLFQDLIEFTTDADPGSGGTTLSAPGLADLVAVSSPDIIALTLDPDESNGAAEIVHVTAHTGSATTATISRAQEGTSARAHPVGTKVVAGVTADALEEFQDITLLEVDGSVEDGSSTALGSEKVIATVSLTIPSDWNSWKCVAWASYNVVSSLGTGVGGSYRTFMRIDGTDQLEKLLSITGPDSDLDGAVAGRRTGMTTTGSRDISLVANGSAAISLDNIFLYARAVRTS